MPFTTPTKLPRTTIDANPGNYEAGLSVPAGPVATVVKPPLATAIGEAGSARPESHMPPASISASTSSGLMADRPAATAAVGVVGGMAQVTALASGKQSAAPAPPALSPASVASGEPAPIFKPTASAPQRSLVRAAVPTPISSPVAQAAEAAFKHAQKAQDRAVAHEAQALIALAAKQEAAWTRERERLLAEVTQTTATQGAELKVERSHVVALSSQLAAAREEIVKLTAQVAKLEKDSIPMSQHNNLLCAVEVKLEAREAGYKRQVSVLTADIKAVQAELDSAREQHASALTAQAESAAASLAAVLEAAAQEKAQVVDEVQAARGRITQLESALSHSEEQLRGMRHVMNGLRRRISTSITGSSPTQASRGGSMTPTTASLLALAADMAPSPRAGTPVADAFASPLMGGGSLPPAVGAGAPGMSPRETVWLAARRVMSRASMVGMPSPMDEAPTGEAYRACSAKTPLPASAAPPTALMSARTADSADAAVHMVQPMQTPLSPARYSLSPRTRRLISAPLGSGTPNALPAPEVASTPTTERRFFNAPAAEIVATAEAIELPEERSTLSDDATARTSMPHVSSNRVGAASSLVSDALVSTSLVGVDEEGDDGDGLLPPPDELERIAAGNTPTRSPTSGPARQDAFGAVLRLRVSDDDEEGASAAQSAASEEQGLRLDLSEEAKTVEAAVAQLVANHDTELSLVTQLTSEVARLSDAMASMLKDNAAMAAAYTMAVDQIAQLTQELQAAQEHGNHAEHDLHHAHAQIERLSEALFIARSDADTAGKLRQHVASLIHALVAMDVTSGAQPPANMSSAAESTNTLSRIRAQIDGATASTTDQLAQAVGNMRSSVARADTLAHAIAAAAKARTALQSMLSDTQAQVEGARQQTPIDASAGALLEGALPLDAAFNTSVYIQEVATQLWPLLAEQAAEGAADASNARPSDAVHLQPEQVSEARAAVTALMSNVAALGVGMSTAMFPSPATTTSDTAYTASSVALSHPPTPQLMKPLFYAASTARGLETVSADLLARDTATAIWRRSHAGLIALLTSVGDSDLPGHMAASAVVQYLLLLTSELQLPSSAKLPLLSLVDALAAAMEKRDAAVRVEVEAGVAALQGAGSTPVRSSSSHHGSPVRRGEANTPGEGPLSPRARALVLSARPADEDASASASSRLPSIMANLSSAASAAEVRCAEALASLSMAKECAAALAARVATAEMAFAGAAAANVSLEAALAHAGEVSTQLVDKVNGALADASSHVNATTAQVAALHHRFDAAAPLAVGTVAAAARLTSLIPHVQSNLSHALSVAEERAAARLNAEREAASRLHQEELAAANARNAHLADRLSALSVDVGRATAQASAEAERVATLRTERESVTNALREAQEQLSVARVDVALAKAEAERLKADMAAGQVQREAAETELHAQRAKVEAELQAQKEKVATLSTRERELTEKVVLYQQEMEALQQAVALAKEAQEVAQERVRVLAGGGSGGSGGGEPRNSSGGSTPSRAHTPALSTSSSFTRSPARVFASPSQPTVSTRLYSSAAPMGSVRQPGSLSSLMGALSSSPSSTALHDPALSFTRQYRAPQPHS